MTLTRLTLLALLLTIAPASAQSVDTASSLDVMWVVMAAVLVFLMQGGFALLGAGAVRTKNTVNYLMKSVMDFALGALVFFTIGFGLMFGTGRYIGTDGFLLGSTQPSADTLLVFLFQVMFAATAATIVAGAVAERMKLRAYVWYTIAITAVIYPVFGHWMWGGGFLAELGALDFAGSGVVHAVGGLLAFVAAWILGPRIGKYGMDGKARRMPGHNQVYVILGTLLLFFGWFGFNAGSTLSAHDTSIPLIAVNTFLAGCAGAVAVFIMSRKTIDLGKVCNGMLSGLVAVTGPCAFIAPWAAIVIGVLGGIIYVVGAALLEHKMRIDDPVGAIAVHGFNGVFGLIAVGIFANGNGVTGLIAGNIEQFLAQLIAAGALLAWTLPTGFVLFKTIDLTIGLRIGAKEEQRGLDDFHHGGSAYPELVAALRAERKLEDTPAPA